EVQPAAGVPEERLLHVLVAGWTGVHFLPAFLLEELLLVLPERGGGEDEREQERSENSGAEPLPIPSHGVASHYERRLRRVKEYRLVSRRPGTGPGGGSTRAGGQKRRCARGRRPRRTASRRTPRPRGPRCTR